MMRGVLTILVFVSIIFFPWQLAAAIALVSGFYIPLLPLAAGIFADTLYYTPQAAALPLFTLWGAFATGIVIFTRRQFRAGPTRDV